jgi:hypothetical protein
MAARSDCLVADNQPKPVVVRVVRVASTMTEKVEQRICIKSCQKL